MADVVIVGGGIIGCATAYYLSMSGASVTLLERDEVAGAASGAAAGILVPPPEALPSGAFGDLCRAGVDVYPSLVEALRDETGIDVQYLAPGILLAAGTEPQAQALRAVARWREGLGMNLEWVEGRPLRGLEPALADSALAADHVVLAAGPWTQGLGRKLGVDVPTRPMRGQMLAYRSTAVRHIIWGEDGYLVPKAGGFLFAGATVEDVGFRPGTTRRGLTEVRRMATAMVPALRYPEVASDWAGLRPGSPDGHPIIGRLPGKDNVFVATGHFRNGILLGPITGRLIAQLITEGKTETPLEAFRPSRFG
jgi:glycine/D-amino acid oxidase-like deaminating enzyme